MSCQRNRLNVVNLLNSAEAWSRWNVFNNVKCKLKRTPSNVLETNERIRHVKQKEVVLKKQGNLNSSKSNAAQTTMSCAGSNSKSRTKCFRNNATCSARTMPARSVSLTRANYAGISSKNKTK